VAKFHLASSLHDLLELWTAPSLMGDRPMPKTDLPTSPARSDEERVALAGVARDAFHFIQEGLERASFKAHGKLPGGVRRPEQTRHISGQQLCEGLRELAIERWGPIAPAVLSSWGIHCTLDFGKIVFALIDAKVFQKQPQDRLEDFANVYDFRRTFVTDFRIALPKAIS
jgi:uncharacterized repeat protein (TIGR04138 family)